MKPRIQKTYQRGGYVSYLMVLSLGVTLLLMMVGAYNTAVDSQKVQADTSLRLDYGEKEDAVLRAIVPIAANRAMLCMQDGSDSSSGKRTPLRWQKIFRSAIEEGNAEESLEASVLKQFGLDGAQRGNPGDDTTYASNTFYPLDGNRNKYVTPGINADLGEGFPAPLESQSSTVTSRDPNWPIISSQKYYGSLSADRMGADVSDYPQYNLMPYPNIRFGYAKPGEPFVAKQNWWAFRMNLADHKENQTKLEKRARDFVISIYEVPSQLAISAEAFTVIGQYADGTDWQNATIEGGIFASRSKVSSGLNLEWISARHGLELSADVTVGANPLLGDDDIDALESSEDGLNMNANLFVPGVRERYELNHGSFMPVSMASESGRAAFVPINRGVDFFDRYAHADEKNTISPTTWNEYTVGAMQCAMHLDITEVSDVDSAIPSELTFHFFKGGVRDKLEVDLEESDEEGLPPGYIEIALENEQVLFDVPVDLAYGGNGKFYFESAASGSVTFDDARFGDPLSGEAGVKKGYYRPSYPFEVTMLHDTKPCLTVYPERFKAFLAQIGGDSTAVNHSLSVNVDYVDGTFLRRPSIPCTDLDYGVILRECEDMTSFTKGFSLVTNLRLYIADDFNMIETTVPADSGIVGPFYPPCSLFAPEKRYGAEVDPHRLKLSGQLGSLAGDADSGSNSVHLLDLKTAWNQEVAHDQVEVNLSPITHPAALPPVTMMNWLVVLEERRMEMYEGNAVAREEFEEDEGEPGADTGEEDASDVWRWEDLFQFW